MGMSNTTPDERAWTSHWNVAVPGKIRTFLWRLAKHSLPTGDVRNHRNMLDSVSCQLCGDEDSWRHSLLECTTSRCVWALIDEDLAEHLMASRKPSAKQWIFGMIDTPPHASFIKLDVTLWAIVGNMP